MTNYYNKDLYKILNVNIDASSDDIKTAYRRLVRIYHPDVADSSSDTEKFKEIQEAYEILSSASKRKKYNTLHGFFTEKIKKESEPRTQKQDKYSSYIKKAKKYAGGPESFTKSINKTLGDLFTAQKQKTASSGAELQKNGGDINIDLSITMLEASNGTNRKVNILHTMPCPNCEGRRFINETQCPMCNGTGQTSIQKKINVKIPKGVAQGDKVRVKNEGNKGINGGKNGDLYLIINIEKNPYFEIDGLNIICNLPVTPFEAVLGAEIPINIMNSKITVKIPPMTSSGQKLRLAGLGLENKQKTQKGDIIIIVSIKLPGSLSSDEKSLYKKLKILSSSDIRSGMQNV